MIVRTNSIELPPNSWNPLEPSSFRRLLASQSPSHKTQNPLSLRRTIARVPGYYSAKKKKKKEKRHLCKGQVVSQTIPEVLWERIQNYPPRSEAKHGGWLIISKKGLVNSHMKIYRQHGSGFNQAWKKGGGLASPGLGVDTVLKGYFGPIVSALLVSVSSSVEWDCSE